MKLKCAYTCTSLCMYMHKPTCRFHLHPQIILFAAQLELADAKCLLMFAGCRQIPHTWNINIILLHRIHLMNFSVATAAGISQLHCRHCCCQCTAVGIVLLLSPLPFPLSLPSPLLPIAIMLSCKSYRFDAC